MRPVPRVISVSCCAVGMKSVLDLLVACCRD
jgi:hypothetical protein